MDEKHPKSFPGKDTSFTVKKYQQIFIDFTHKKLGEKLSAKSLSGLLNKKNTKWQRNSHISTDTETSDPDANDLQVARSKTRKPRKFFSDFFSSDFSILTQY